MHFWIAKKMDYYFQFGALSSDVKNVTLFAFMFFKKYFIDQYRKYIYRWDWKFIEKSRTNFSTCRVIRFLL